MKASRLLVTQRRDVERILEKIDEADEPRDQRAYFEELAMKLCPRGSTASAPAGSAPSPRPGRAGA